MPHVLVAYSSKMGGTEQIASLIARTLFGRGVDVTLQPAMRVHTLEPYDAVVVGSAIYSGGWQRDSVRVIGMLAEREKKPPVWLFHSGPLGDSVEDQPQRLPDVVRRLTERVELREVATFGGRLDEHPKGLMARAMARSLAGDWRDWGRITEWATTIADAVLGARAA